MRYDKTVYAPEEAFVCERIDPSRPREGREAVLYHMRPSHNGLICAEGCSTVSSLSAPGRVYVTDDAVYVYESAQKSLLNVTANIRTSGIPTEPVALVVHVTEMGVKGLYCVEKTAVRYICEGSVRNSWSVGGDCAAMYHGRLFTASGRRLNFSAPYSAEGITQTERDPDKAAYIDFDEGKGNIVALVPLRERLYVFFERGIMKMRAGGEALDFDAAEVSFRGGSVLPGSVAFCGDRVCYMTKSGLFSFNGSSCDLLEGKRAEIDLSVAVRGLCMNGKYAAAVKLVNAKTALYVYDFEERVGRFILEKGLLSAERERFLAGTTLYALSETGGSPLGYDCSLVLTVSTQPRKLAWVRVEGEGSFEIRCTGTGSEVYPAEGDEKVRIPSRQKLSETQISVTAKSAAFRIRAVEIAWRKEDGD